MPQPHKLPDYTEFPKMERHPLPITSLPVNSITQEMDPTLEIRTLIEQLQQTARDARGQARTAEQERDAVMLELARAQQQIEALRQNERELRSHFVEITTLIRERDAALDESERRGAALTEAARKNENLSRERQDMLRQREDALRQRDEATRKFEAIHRGSEDQARLVADSQRQMLAIRQARDTAHSQINELNHKLGATEDQLAETEYQRDAAQKGARQAAAEAADIRRQLEIASAARDATARQVEQLSAELDAHRQKLLDLAEQKSAALENDSEHVAALAEARTQVASLTQERDAARLRTQEQTRELEDLRAEFQAFRGEAAKTSSVALDEAHEKVAALEAQVREARQEGNHLRQRLDALTEQAAALQSTAEDAASRQGATQEQLAAIRQERDAALTSLTAAHKQIDHIIRDRDQHRQRATENALELEARLTALQAQLTATGRTTAETAALERELSVLNSRFEKQRVQSIDVAAQLQAAQRQILELSASLAEARLQVKFHSSASRSARDSRPKSDAPILAVVPNTPDAEPVADEEPAPMRPAPLALNIEEPLTEKQAKSALHAMRHCFQSFTRTPTDSSLLNEMHCHVQGFAERARVSGFIGLHRLCAAFADLTRGLYEIPELVNPSTLRTVHQTIEFLAALMKEKNVAQAKDPAKMLIYAVDDDPGNCESIALAMEESMMRTTYAQDPTVALAELAGNRYDLIFLDVNMPGMDGFELCRQLRALPTHATTPIVFLTGLATLENRVQSSLSGGNDFIAKPFNLRELTVKAITLILKAQFQFA